LQKGKILRTDSGCQAFARGGGEDVDEGSFIPAKAKALEHQEACSAISSRQHIGNGDR
jgi:hypothetical protein